MCAVGRQLLNPIHDPGGHPERLPHLHRGGDGPQRDHDCLCHLPGGLPAGTAGPSAASATPARTGATPGSAAAGTGSEAPGARSEAPGSRPEAPGCRTGTASGCGHSDAAGCCDANRHPYGNCFAYSERVPGGWSL